MNPQNSDKLLQSKQSDSDCNMFWPWFISCSLLCYGNSDEECISVTIKKKTGKFSFLSQFKKIIPFDLVSLIPASRCNHQHPLLYAGGIKLFWDSDGSPVEFGVWVSTGKLISQFFWDEGQPTLTLNGLIESCLCMPYKTAGFPWHDCSCNNSLCFICEQRLEVKNDMNMM